jgi:hypothetical protein
MAYFMIATLISLINIRVNATTIEMVGWLAHQAGVVVNLQPICGVVK